MTRQRMRPAHTPEQLAQIYATPHDHTRWKDHHLRVAATIEVAKWMTEDTGAYRAADLSCGNGAILRSLGMPGLHFGDLAPGHRYTGPIEETIEQIPDVHAFICSETLEHLDDPDAVLKAIRAKTRTLVLSTPVDAWGDTNLEHYWAWSREDVEEMLTAAGFTPVVYTAVDFRPMGLPYCFGIWGAK